MPLFSWFLCGKSTADCCTTFWRFQIHFFCHNRTKNRKFMFCPRKFWAQKIFAPNKRQNCVRLKEQSNPKNCGGSLTFEKRNFANTIETTAPLLLQWRPNFRHWSFRWLKLPWKEILQIENFYFCRTRKTTKMHWKSTKKISQIFLKTQKT